MLEAYLGGEEPDEATLLRCLRKGTVAGKLVPVLCGSAFKNKGVQPLLDAVVDFLPSPIDVPPTEGPEARHRRDRSSAVPADDEPFAALAFKIMTDPFVGTLTFVRVYSGVIESGSYLQNTVKDKRERIGRILQMHANSREEVKEARAGDIVALVGLKNTTTGDTLSDEQKPVVLERMEFPEPVIEVAVEPKTKADQEKLGVALSKLAAEDPVVPRRYRPGVGPDRDQGHGRAPPRDHRRPHEARVQGRRQRRRSRRSPIARRSPRDADVDYTHKKQTGGSGQFARIKLRFSPGEQGTGFVFDAKVVGGAVPKEYIPGVQKGLESARARTACSPASR